MTSGWANLDEIGTGSIFEAVHSGLTVQLIATPRDRFVTCTADEPAAAAILRNDLSYDYLPVVADDVGEKQIIGLFSPAAFSDGATATGEVRDHLIPLTEEYLIGADTSIRDFVISADTKPCRLVLAGPHIGGLVSLSDLQKLPVRAALFALITGFEIAMTEAIRKIHANSDGWMQRLSDGRQTALLEEIEKSKTDDGYVDALLFTQFCDKANIIRKSLSFGQSNGNIKSQLSEIQKLRDGLAHANEYAAGPSEAMHVCAVVRNILTLNEELKKAAPDRACGPNGRK